MDLRCKKAKIGISLLAAGAVLLAASIAFAASGGEGGSLSPAKVKDLAWRAVNFACLVAILIYFLKKPVANALSGRRMSIMKQFEELNERRAEVEATYKKYEDKLGQIDQEVQSILAAAKEQAEAEKERIISEATRAAEDLKRKAEIAVQFELAQAKTRLKSEVAEQAAAVAEELIRKNLNEADQTKLVEDYLDKVGALQ